MSSDAVYRDVCFSSKESAIPNLEGETRTISTNIDTLVSYFRA